MSNIEDRQPDDLFKTVGENSSVGEAYASNLDMYDQHHGIQRTTANVGRTFVDWDTSSQTSVRSDFSREDYDYYRRKEQIPKKDSEIIRICDKAYQRVGIVRNVIDLMGDFACKGIRLQHPVPSIERFYNQWFKKINAAERSERFLNNFYRIGQVVVNRSFGKITLKNLREMKKTYGEDNIRIEDIKTKKRNIPLKYSFMHPNTIEIVGGKLASFVGKPIYALKISGSLRHEYNRMSRLSGSNREVAQSIIGKIPAKIRTALAKGSTNVLLDPDKVSAFHYKKDDWDDWAKPIVFSILDDLILLEKMKLADLSALDGAISNIRLWTVGVLDGANSIIPTKGMLQKVRNILAQNIGGGVLDLVWGPELSFSESQSKVYLFLGKAKYETTLDSIYDGLGIPSSMRSSASGSNANNFIALKTLIERLEYGRETLTTFWDHEIKLVQKAMGFTSPATLVFDEMIMSDEVNYKKLLLELADRDIISNDSLLERFGIKSDLEALRVKREVKKRGEGMPHKASPYHAAQPDHEYKKIILQGGGVAPSELGVELQEKKEGELSRNEQTEKMQLKLKEVGDKNTNIGSSGRPSNVTETKKRKKQPADKPRQNTKGFVNNFMWANDAQKTIAEMVTPAILHSYGKKNARSLSKKESETLEYLKACVLFTLEPYEEITKEKVYNSLKNEKLDEESVAMIKTLAFSFSLKNDRSPSVDEMRQIQSSTFALKYEELE